MYNTYLVISIKFDSLEKICMTLKCSPNELLGWKQDK
ncbi:helix-turn-helix domain-containing protein [Clostridioides sp. ZZV15-6388]